MKRISYVPGSTPQTFKFNCPKCANNIYEVSELRGSSDGFSAYFNLDLQIMTLVTCANCTYTEIYRLSLKDFKQRFKLKLRDG